MSHLHYKKTNGVFAPWSIGGCTYITGFENRPQRYTIAIQCRLDDIENDELAMLDTGAEWSILPGELSEILGCNPNNLNSPIPINSRFGRFEGYLDRVNITLLSENTYGRDLKIEATMVVLPEWNHVMVLGYRGFLERIRIAVDPGNQYSPQIFHFGEI